MSKQSNTAADDENTNTTTIDALNKELVTSCQIGTNNNEKKKKDTISLSSTTTTTYLSSCLKSKTGLQTRELFGGAIQMNIPTYWRDVSQVRQVPDNQEVFQDCTDNNDNDDDDQNKKKKKKKELLSSSYEGTNGCIVIELLERQNDVLDNDAPRFFVDDLVESTDKGDDKDDNDDALPPSPHNKTNISSKLQKKAVIQHQTIWQKQQQQQQNTNTTTMNSKEKKSSTKSSSHNQQQQQQHHHQHHLASNFQSVATACSCFALHKLEGSESSGSSSGGVQIELCVIRLEDIQTDLLVILTVPIQQDTTTTTMKKKKETTDDDAGLERIEIENSKHTILFWRIVSSLLIKDWSLFC